MEEIGVRASSEYKALVEKVAEDLGWSVSKLGRVAFAEFIETHTSESVKPEMLRVKVGRPKGKKR